MKRAMKKAASVFLALAMVLAGLVVAPTTASATEATGEETYNVYLGLQTPNWTYRNNWLSNTADGTTDATFGTEYWDGLVINGSTDNGTTGTITDAVVAGNGVYTVSVTDFGSQISDDFTSAGQEYFNLIFLSTDIPLDAGVTISNVILEMDGKTIYTYEEAYQNPDDETYVEISLYNLWNTEYEWPAEVTGYMAPTESISITFTVSGMSYDNPDAVAVEDEESEASEAETTVVDDSDDADDSDDSAADDNAASSSDSDDSEDEGGVSAVVIVVIIIIVVVIIVAVVMSSKKKK